MQITTLILTNKLGNAVRVKKQYFGKLNLGNIFNYSFTPFCRTLNKRNCWSHDSKN